MRKLGKAIDRLPPEKIEEVRALWMDKTQNRMSVSFLSGLSLDTCLAIREQLGLPKWGRGKGGGPRGGELDPDGIAARTIECQMRWSDDERELRRRQLDTVDELLTMADSKQMRDPVVWRIRQI